MGEQVKPLLPLAKGNMKFLLEILFAKEARNYGGMLGKTSRLFERDIYRITV